ncbi:hypothetical protein BD779DRAFT_1474819 [Infundibulicybe gibba]|nr:hypothetical protein BD779DRAFT_1474819 [Infundibulicybe gibba]
MPDNNSGPPDPDLAAKIPLPSSPPPTTTSLAPDVCPNHQTFVDAGKDGFRLLPSGKSVQVLKIPRRSLRDYVRHDNDLRAGIQDADAPIGPGEPAMTDRLFRDLAPKVKAANAMEVDEERSPPNGPGLKWTQEIEPYTRDKSGKAYRQLLDTRDAYEQIPVKPETIRYRNFDDSALPDRNLPPPGDGFLGDLAYHGIRELVHSKNKSEERFIERERKRKRGSGKKKKIMEGDHNAEAGPSKKKRKTVKVNSANDSPADTDSSVPSDMASMFKMLMNCLGLVEDGLKSALQK